METILPIILFIFAAFTFANGFISEYYQSRHYNQNAKVATLPFAVPAAIFIILGLITLNIDIPVWQYVVIFFVSVLIFGFCIVKASMRRSE